MISTMSKKISFCVLLGALLWFSAPALNAIAAPTQGCSSTGCGYTLLEPLGTFTGIDQGTSDLSGYVNSMLRILISVGALFGVATLTIGGVMYMTSADSPGLKSKAKDRMWASIWGLLLLTACVLILKTVNPQLLNFNLNSLGNINQTQQNTSTSCPYGTDTNGVCNPGPAGQSPN